MIPATSLFVLGVGCVVAATHAAIMIVDCEQVVKKRPVFKVDTEQLSTLGRPLEIVGYPATLDAVRQIPVLEREINVVARLLPVRPALAEAFEVNDQDIWHFPQVHLLGSVLL